MNQYTRNLLCGATLVLLSGLTSCLPTWSLDGPYACRTDGTCAAGYQCDEGVCCVPGSSPACPTLAFGPTCPDGKAPMTLFEDLDGDGFGNELVTSARCAIPKSKRWVMAGGDCDDANKDTNPNTIEKCNGVDDNCNRDLDEGLTRTAFFRDEDGDGYGRDDATVQACIAPRGYVSQGSDCDDFSPARRPGLTESCNAIDDNCNGLTDEVPLIDVFNVNTSAATDFECVTGLFGARSAGNLRCQNNRKVCVPRRAPSREVCDGIDNDCNNAQGGADEQPECGGPISIRSADVKVGVKSLPRVGTSALITDQCLKSLDGGVDNWNGTTGVWSFVQPNDNFMHLLWFEPADGGVWDLSRNNLSLQLDLSASWSPSFTAPGGAWTDSNNGGVRNPVVYACGNTPDQFVRYVPPAGQYLQVNTASMSQRIPLGGSPGWIVGKGSGFDMSAVRHVEVLLWPNAQPTQTTFTIQVGAATGFSQ